MNLIAVKFTVDTEHDPPLLTEESNVNLTNENVMRWRYKLGKILSSAWWKGTSPKGQRI